MTDEPVNKGSNWVWPLRISEEERKRREEKMKDDLAARRRKLFEKSDG